MAKDASGGENRRGDSAGGREPFEPDEEVVLTPDQVAQGVTVQAGKRVRVILVQLPPRFSG